MKFYLLLIGFVLGGTSFAQTCNCTYTITKAGSYDGAQLKIGPGATVCIQAGNYKYLRLNNFTGAPGNPIKFVNCGGLVDVSHPAGSTTGIAFQGCRYFRITGTGDSRYQYGIHISKTGTNISGLNITTKSSDCEVDNLEVSGTGFAGIMIKTDPNCDASTHRGNFTMYNVKVHHNYVHDTVGEGLYIGNSFWNGGQSRTCNEQGVKVLPHNIIGLEISYNQTVNTGCEGIQYACAPESQVHHNTVINSGIQPFDAYQDNGVQIGGGVSGRFYNNIIRQSRGMGLIVVGHLGPNYIYNNIITDSGDNGIFVDERAGTLPSVAVMIANNTIVTTAGEGIQLYNETQINQVVNTAILNAAGGKFISTLNKSVRVTAQNNFTSMNIADAKFANIGGGDYHTLAGSPMIDVGQNLSGYGLVSDLDDIGRPQGGAYDIGAYETNQSGNRQGRISAAVQAELSETVLVQAFPSPAVERLTVRLSSEEQITELSIIDGAGRLVARHQPDAPATEITVPVAQLGSGLYLVRVGSTVRQYAGRFLKQ